MPLIALEIFLGFGVPLVWATYELISLRREQRRDRERAESGGAEGLDASGTPGSDDERAGP